MQFNIKLQKFKELCTIANKQGMSANAYVYKLINDHIDSMKEEDNNDS